MRLIDATPLEEWMQAMVDCLREMYQGKESVVMDVMEMIRDEIKDQKTLEVTIREKGTE